jgi:hypothetical protein
MLTNTADLHVYNISMALTGGIKFSNKSQEQMLIEFMYTKIKKHVQVIGDKTAEQFSNIFYITSLLTCDTTKWASTACLQG